MSDSKDEEWYVFLEGKMPVRAIKGRRAALDALADDYLTTPSERSWAGAFLENPKLGIGASFMFVGYGNRKDRTLVRIPAPL